MICEKCPGDGVVISYGYDIHDMRFDPCPYCLGGEVAWTTKDGRKIRIEDMTADHLRNTVAYLRRNAEAFRAYASFDHFFRGKPPNGEMAQIAWEHEGRSIERLSDDDVLRREVPQFPYLLQEMEARGIAA